MKLKIFCIALCLCAFTACEKDEPIIPEEPVEPPIEQPDKLVPPVEPEEPDVPIEPEEPQEPRPIEGIINWNNEFIIGGNNMQVGTWNWMSITFGNGKYVIVSGDGMVSSSTDGVNWYTPQKIVKGPLFQVAFGNGKFVATTGGSSEKIKYSVDGVNWYTASAEKKL